MQQALRSLAAIAEAHAQAIRICASGSSRSSGRWGRPWLVDPQDSLMQLDTEGACRTDTRHVVFKTNSDLCEMETLRIRDWGDDGSLKSTYGLKNPSGSCKSSLKHHPRSFPPSNGAQRQCHPTGTTCRVSSWCLGYRRRRRAQLRSARTWIGRSQDRNTQGPAAMS
jgi:hypothetical protein